MISLPFQQTCERPSRSVSNPGDNRFDRCVGISHDDIARSLQQNFDSAKYIVAATRAVDVAQRYLHCSNLRRKTPQSKLDSTLNKFVLNVGERHASRQHSNFHLTNPHVSEKKFTTY